MYELIAILFLLLTITGIGIFFTQLLKLKFVWELVSIYFIVGLVIWILVNFIFRYFGISFIWPISGLLILSLIGYKSVKSDVLKLKKKFQNVFGANKHNLVLRNGKLLLLHLSIIILSVMILSTIGFFQGYQRDGSLKIYDENYHDILWHMALSQTLLNGFPVENPIYSGSVLKGYHYLTDFFWSTINYITGISLENLLLKWEVWIFAILFGETSFLLFRKIFPNDLTKSILAAVLELFAGGIAFYVPFMVANTTNNPSLFWLDQPANYVINPQLLLSFSFVNIFVTMMITSKKWWPILGLILGSLVAIKVYAFLVLGVSFGLLSLINLWKRDFEYVKALVVAALVSVVILLLTNVGQGNPFILEPGWFIQTMYVTSDHLNLSDWELKRQVFVQDHNYIRLVILWLEGILVFEFGNFGLKFLALLTIPLFVFWRRKEKLQDWYTLAILMAFISLILPLFLLQKGVPWSSIQFMHYAQLPLCLLLLSFLDLFPRRVWISTVLLIIILGLPTTLSTTFRGKDLGNYNTIRTLQIQGMKKIKQLPEDSRIFVDQSLLLTSLVPAISGRNVYYADPIILDIILVDYKSRVQYLADLKSSRVNCSSNDYIISKDVDVPNDFVVIENNKYFAIMKCKL